MTDHDQIQAKIEETLGLCRPPVLGSWEGRASRERERMDYISKMLPRYARALEEALPGMDEYTKFSVVNIFNDKSEGSDGPS
ncbi:hypothetical protein LCGC14_1129820 [marine sediment metagenome]|uniref:Uncharacterized protein n=1 Tax=marine sediment metagenome TaxID=412755 RepID=A0A0F9Q743_9ZZZZ